LLLACSLLISWRISPKFSSSKSFIIALAMGFVLALLTNSFQRTRGSALRWTGTLAGTKGVVLLKTGIEAGRGVRGVIVTRIGRTVRGGTAEY
jgi:hypothetical protein